MTVSTVSSWEASVVFSVIDAVIAAAPAAVIAALSIMSGVMRSGQCGGGGPGAGWIAFDQSGADDGGGRGHASPVLFHGKAVNRKKLELWRRGTLRILLFLGRKKCITSNILSLNIYGSFVCFLSLRGVSEKTCPMKIGVSLFYSLIKLLTVFTSLLHISHLKIHVSYAPNIAFIFFSFYSWQKI